MFLLILLAVFLVLGVAGGLAMRRSKAIQDNPNFSPSDHVEVTRGVMGRNGRAGTSPTETHHDGEDDTFQMGD